MKWKKGVRKDVDREILEKMALEACSAELYYDLLDNLEQTSNEDLWCIVENANF